MGNVYSNLNLINVRIVNTYIQLQITEGSLEVKLLTLWTDEKQRWEESEERRDEERSSKRESLRRKKIQVREKVVMNIRQHVQHVHKRRKSNPVPSFWQPSFFKFATLPRDRKWRI